MLWNWVFPKMNKNRCIFQPKTTFFIEICTKIRKFSCGQLLANYSYVISKRKYCENCIFLIESLQKIEKRYKKSKKAKKAWKKNQRKQKKRIKKIIRKIWLQSNQNGANSKINCSKCCRRCDSVLKWRFIRIFIRD